MTQALSIFRHYLQDLVLSVARVLTAVLVNWENPGSGENPGSVLTFLHFLFEVFKFLHGTTDGHVVYAMNLAGEEVIRRFLQHVLPKGLTRYRYGGVFNTLHEVR